jgi:hypothetical protein
VAYLTLNKGTRKYQCVEGFDRLFFVAPDVRSYEVKDDLELLQKYQDFCKGVWEFCGPYLDANWLEDYSFVLTPAVCDSKYVEGMPFKRDNYIVTPFNDDDFSLIADVVVKSQMSAGDDRRPTLGFYIAMEVSEKHPDLVDVEHKISGFKEYQMAISQAQVQMVDALAKDYVQGKVRAFISSRDVGYFEQYFDRSIKKETNNLCLADGWLKCMLSAKTRTSSAKCEKYVVAMDLFNSTGSDFAQFALNKDSLKVGREQFAERNGEAEN